MQSSSGTYYPGLDHVRALAAFLVVTWHFTHGWAGAPVPFNEAPELGLLDEGHVGVSLFMTLSGYLFAKLIAGRTIDYGAFLWNRALRLAAAARGGVARRRVDPLRGSEATISSLAPGAGPAQCFPTAAGRSPTEMHFYLVLPLLLWASARWRWAPLALVAVALCLRVGHHCGRDLSVQDAAYWTIIGRIDQFAFGIFFYQRGVSGRFAAAGGGRRSSLFYAAFDAAGGFYGAGDRRGCSSRRSRGSRWRAHRMV